LLRVKARTTSLALGLMAGAPVVLLFMVSRFSQSVFIDRIFLASCAFVPILLAAPLVWMPAGMLRRCWAVVLVLMLVGEAWSLRGQWLGEHREDWRGASQFVQQQRSQPGQRTIVVFVANEGEMLFDYYARGSDYAMERDLLGLPADFFQPRDGGRPRTMQQVLSDSDLAFLQNILAKEKFDRLLLVDSHQAWSDPSQRTLEMLLDQLELRDRRDFLGVTVFEFSPVP
jgi:hypothetical protein